MVNPSTSKLSKRKNSTSNSTVISGKEIKKNENRKGNKSTSNTKSKTKVNIDDKTLERMAIEEIYKEIAVKSIRAKKIGPSGWLDATCGKTNKRFLSNTLRSAMKFNERSTNIRQKQKK